MPDQSLPKRMPAWADLKGAYRFLSHPDITPDEIQATHRSLVRAQCADHAVVLVVQDTTELDYGENPSVEGLTPLHAGSRHGLFQHSSLAVTTEGELLGVVHQIWWARQAIPKNETREQRHARFKESDVWPASVRAVGRLGPTTLVIHVVDRGGDSFEFMLSCKDEQVGFLVRAQHDRTLTDGRKLWAALESQPVAGIFEVDIAAKSATDARILKPAMPAQPARTARLALRYAEVTLAPPVKDPRFTTPLTVRAVHVREIDPPQGADPIEWMLLTDQPVSGFAAARVLVDYYSRRWIIEEWHRVEKTGCGLEAAQLKTADAIKRLAALTAVVAVRLLQLRDVARNAAPIDDAAHLAQLVPESWIHVVARSAKCKPSELTPKSFWLTLAKRGGYLARKSDGPPGWQTIWRGWYDLMLLVAGYEMAMELHGNNCG